MQHIYIFSEWNNLCNERAVKQSLYFIFNNIFSKHLVIIEPNEDKKMKNIKRIAISKQNKVFSTILNSVLKLIIVVCTIGSSGFCCVLIIICFIISIIFILVILILILLILLLYITLPL